MIFDERDLENEEDKDIKPTEKQLSFDELMSQSDALLSEKNQEEEQEIEHTPKTKRLKTQEQLKKEIEKVKKILDKKHLEEEQKAYISFDGTYEVPTENQFDEEGNMVKNVRQVLHESMLPYSEYVILDRALPRVEDGLKPVQRRILYSMFEQGITPDKPYVKSARVVGEVLGKYHPHGDSSVYNAMVRLAQNFNMRETLISGHGNFGSVDGDGAAAMRYTECKLANLAMELLKDLEKNTVRWNLTYDDSRKEPDMLPACFPNLLVNGASGIAVGLATNIPPHNLGECLEGVSQYLSNPKITLKEMMKIIKAPDFPTGGTILAGEDLIRAYETGKGKITIRAKYFIEKDKTGKESIVLTEFPYQVNKAVCLQKIVSLKEDNKDILNDISDVRDESDRDGTRAVIVLKKDANPEKIIKYLLKYSDLQISFAINMVAIAGGKPQQLGLLEIIKFYADHRCSVVLSRSKFDYENAKDKAHILEGLIVAIKNIDEIIKIIKKAENQTDAKAKMRAKFSLSEKQAQAIMDMRLGRLTHLEVEKLEEEIKELHALIEKLLKIINSKKELINVVKAELMDVKKRYKSPRLANIISDDDQFSNEALKEEFKTVKNYIVAIGAKNNIKKIPEKNFNMTSRIVSETTNLNEVHSILLNSDSEKTIFAFSDNGVCYKIAVDSIGEARWKERGTSIKDVAVGFTDNDKIVSAFNFDDGNLPDGEFVFTTLNGLVKKTLISEFNVKKTSFASIGLKENDKLLKVEIYDKNKNLLLVSSDGNALKINLNDLSATGRTSQGIKGINLNENEKVAGSCLVKNNDLICVLANNGNIKNVNENEIEIMQRARKGVKIISFDKSQVIFCDLICGEFEVFALDNKNNSVSIKTKEIAVENRTTKGKSISKKNKNINLSLAYKYSWDAENLV